jgi:hypothetical protein
MTWLVVFQDLLHATEASAQIAAPIVAVLNPVLGALILQAANALVGAEAIFTERGDGPRRAALVRAQTEATVSLINTALKAQNKPLLPDNTTDVVQVHIKAIVAGLNTVAEAATASVQVVKA